MSTASVVDPFATGLTLQKIKVADHEGNPPAQKQIEDDLCKNLRLNYLVKLGKWMDEVQKLDRHQLAQRFVPAIRLLEISLGQLTDEYSRFGAEFSAWKFVPEVLFTESIRERLRPITVRILKYAFACYTVLPECDCADSASEGPSSGCAACHNSEHKGMRQFYDMLVDTTMIITTDQFGLRDFVYECCLDVCKAVIHRAAHDISANILADGLLRRLSDQVEVLQGWLATLPLAVGDVEVPLQAYANKSFVLLMTEKAYDLMVRQYPATKNAIVDLNKVMSSCEWYGRDRFTAQLQKDVRKHLLHAAVDTTDVLKGYAAAVASLSIFDPSFVLVHKICRLIRDYVKSRPDTMRTIINFITTEKPGDSGHTTTLMMDEEHFANANDEYVIMEEDNRANRWFQWKPDPYDADPRESRLFRESADVFNMLVSVYGSKDLFIKEYNALLAERLIANGWSSHLESEFVYLETMKKRFTEGELNQCEVMMRDIKESARLAQLAAKSVPMPISARVLSSFYWPQVKSEAAVEIQPPLKDCLDAYTKIFEETKAQRTVTWYADYGSSVQLELQIGDSVIEIEAPLIQTQILMLFLEKDVWSMEELKKQTGLDKAKLNKRMLYWSTMGILKQGPLDNAVSETWTLNDTASDFERFSKQQLQANVEENASDEEEEEEIPLDVQVESLEQYWAYTKNLLMFRGQAEPLTPQRLAAMYKMFASPGKPGPSVEAVTTFMQRKMRENLVIFENGIYRSGPDLKR